MDMTILASITAFATVALAGITWMYVRQVRQSVEVMREQADITRQSVEVMREQADITRQSVEVMREQADITRQSVEVMREQADITKDTLDANNRPEIVLYLWARGDISLVDEDGDFIGFIELRVQNMGTGYATDVKFTGDLTFKSAGLELLGEDRPLGEIEPFKSGITYLGAGYYVDTILCNLKDVKKGTVPTHDFSITVSYKDSTNNKKSRTFRFYTGDWKNNPDQFVIFHKVG